MNVKFIVKVVLLLFVSIGAVTILRRNIESCHIAQQLPCRIGRQHFYPASANPLLTGRHGLVQLAFIPGDDSFYVIKFSKMEKKQSRGNEHVVNELYLTVKLGEMLRNNSIQIIYKHHSKTDESYQFAMVMPFYCYGTLGNVGNSEQWDSLSQYKDGQIIEFLVEMSLVLETMWSLGYVDRDFRLSNVLITGNLSHPNTTTYVKIDYGAAIKAKYAVSELITERGRKHGFCQFGSNVK